MAVHGLQLHLRKQLGLPELRPAAAAAVIVASARTAAPVAQETAPQPQPQHHAHELTAIASRLALLDAALEPVMELLSALQPPSDAALGKAAGGPASDGP